MNANSQGYSLSDSWLRPVRQIEATPVSSKQGEFALAWAKKP
jgi:hypothetical protein